MFGFGDDNEEKLEENMEEIKNLVDDQAEKGQLPDETDQWTRQELSDMDFSSEELENEAQKMEEPQQEQQPQEQAENQEQAPEQQSWEEEPDQRTPERNEPAGEREEHKPLEDEIERFEKSMQDEEQKQWKSERDRTETRTTENRERRESRRESSVRRGRPSENREAVKANIPEPAETRQINVPEIEKGPLFIRQRKFERASQLIYDMNYLVNEIESIVNTIEDDLQRDEETENQLRQLVGEFKDERTEVERIVSVGEE